MRLLMKVFVALVVCVVVIGIWRGWFSMSRSTPEPANDKVNVTVSVDRAKMKSDIKKVEGKIEEEVKELEGDFKNKETAK